MSENCNLKRTAMCGSFRKDDAGCGAVVMGWVQRRRSLGSLVFIDLRDRTGIVQVVVDDKTEESVFKIAESVRTEYVIAVSGKVRMRESRTDKILTGDVEILAEKVEILSEADTTPFEISDDVSVNENLRLKYRYLDLRRPSLQHNFLVRSRICQAARNYLFDNGFMEIETPYLGKSTPEGARDYLVPSRIHEGSFYALPQSPQLYKQLLMIAGYDRYYQIAKCFRDEDLRANRQPEFTQIDLEMSFAFDEKDVMYLVEGLIKRIFKEAANIDLGNGHFRMLPYDEAMSRFGSDKPDTRFGLELVDVSNEVKNSEFSVFSAPANLEGSSVRAIVVKGKANDFSRKELDALVEFAKTLGAKGLAWLSKPNGEAAKSSFNKFLNDELLNALTNKLNIEDGDICFFAADKDTVVFNTLGGLRLKLADKFNLYDKNSFDILWVVDFPMFEYSEEEGRYVAMHHPFTAPKDEDLHLLDSDPTKMKAKAYDLVINGQEAGGGSIRIHSREIQRKIFNILKFSDEDIQKKFGFFVNAFNYGTPPHGGLAFGLDRLTMLLCHTESIKDVIAFPKVQNASCLMSEAPSTVEDKQLDELFLAIKKEDKSDK